MIPLGHPSTWKPTGRAPFHDFDSMIHFLDCVRKQNDDSLTLLDGLEGSGKSTVLFHVAKRLNPDWKPETGLIIDYDDWEEVYELETGQVFILDEGGDLLFSRNSQTKESKLIVRMLQMSRIYNHTLLVAAPNIHWVDLYVRGHRTLVYGHVHKKYHANGVQRGLVSWHWPRRYFDYQNSEWMAHWDHVFDSRFHPVSDEGGEWSEYETWKKLKVQKRKSEMTQRLSR